MSRARDAWAGSLCSAEVETLADAPDGDRELWGTRCDLAEQLELHAIRVALMLWRVGRARAGGETREPKLSELAAILKEFVAQHEHHEFVDLWHLDVGDRRILAIAHPVFEHGFAFEFGVGAQPGQAF